MADNKNAFSDFDVVINNEINRRKLDKSLDKLTHVMICKHLDVSKETYLKKRKDPTQFTIQQLIIIADVSNISFKELIHAIHPCS